MGSCQDARPDVVEESFDSVRLAGMSYLSLILEPLHPLRMSFCYGAKWLVSNRCCLIANTEFAKIAKAWYQVRKGRGLGG